MTSELIYDRLKQHSDGPQLDVMEEATDARLHDVIVAQYATHLFPCCDRPPDFTCCAAEERTGGTVWVVRVRTQS
jgi:hypothetical protein